MTGDLAPEDAERMAHLAEGAVLASITGGVAVLSVDAMLFLTDHPESVWTDALDAAAHEVGVDPDGLSMRFVVNLGNGVVAGMGADGVARRFRLGGLGESPLDPGSEAA